MPFTPSHAVVALPFLRTRLVPAAIAVGAMAPDVPLFVPLGPFGYLQTHSWVWLPVTTALSLLLLLAWRCALRPAARELSPVWLARRLPPGWDADSAAAARETFARRGSRHPSLSGTALLIVALAFGVATHIAWDLFTHDGRAGIPVLQADWGPLPGYRWLQHGSSVLGLGILAGWAAARLRKADAAASPTRRLPSWVRWAWWGSLPVILVLASAMGFVWLGPFRTGFGPEHLAYRVLPPACALWGVITLVLCIGMQLLRRGRARP